MEQQHQNISENIQALEAEDWNPESGIQFYIHFLIQLILWIISKGQLSSCLEVSIFRRINVAYEQEKTFKRNKSSTKSCEKDSKRKKRSNKSEIVTSFPFILLALNI